MKLRSLGILVAAAAATVFGAMSASANTIQFNYNAGLSTPGSGLYTYDVVIDNQSHIAPGGTNQGTILDYPSLLTGSTSFVSSLPAGWTATLSFPSTNATIAGLGLAPPLVDTGALNVQLDFTGSGVATDLTNVLLGELTVGSTIKIATLVDPGNNSFSQDYKNSIGPGTLGPQRTLTSTVVPVPVPAAAWTGLTTLAGLAGIGAVRRRRSA
jgi:MYXO-CTERM domain-containing protein